MLFSGTEPVSWVIRAATGSPYSHIGEVVRCELGVLLWEATTLSDIRDLDTGQLVRGVQIVPLSERLARYRGRVAIRRLQPGLLEGQVRELYALRRELSRRPYEEHVLELLRAAWERFPGARGEDLSTLFCSELVAESLQRVGLLPESRPSDRFAPGDFAAGAAVDELLATGYRYGPEVEVAIT